MPNFYCGVGGEQRTGRLDICRAKKVIETVMCAALMKNLVGLGVLDCITVS